MLIWRLTKFDSKFNAFFLDIPNDVQISLRAKLNYRGASVIIPVSNFPPKAVEIAIKKYGMNLKKLNLFNEQL